MNRPLMNFSTANPTGDKPGIEPVRLDLLKAAVNNMPTPAPTPAPVDTPVPTPQPVAIAPASTPVAAPSLINKNIRLPADLVEFIDYTYTKDKRMKKQDAYTEALEAYFRPLMTKQP